jgi:hypothetical protein
MGCEGEKTWFDSRLEQEVFLSSEVSYSMGTETSFPRKKAAVA